MARDFAAELKSAAAKRAFVKAAWRSLSPKAVRHLMSLDPAAVPAWAARWRVNAPCLIEYVTAKLDTLSSCSSHDQKRARRVLLARHHNDGGIPGNIVTAHELKEWERRVLLARHHDDSKRSVIPGDMVAVREPEEWEREWQRELSRLLPPARDPLAADPLWESKGDFLRRAAAHYDARKSRLDEIRRKHNVSEPRSLPELEKHTDWLVQFQLQGRSYKQIADAAGHTQEGCRITVSKAVQHLAQLIDLPLRPTPVGRPRRRSTMKK